MVSILVRQGLSDRHLGIWQEKTGPTGAFPAQPTTLGGKRKIVGAKLLCSILLSFFLGYQLLLGTKSRSALDFGELQRGCFLEQNQVLPLTSGSFGGVAFWNKIAFRSGLCKASERLLLQRKSRSALDFGGESFGVKFTTASRLC